MRDLINARKNGEWDMFDWIDEDRPDAEMPKRTEESAQNVPNDDLVSRKAAIDALWKALYEYEDKTEKQFIDSEELDVADWIQHRNFVQNMSDIDRQTILGLPSAQPDSKELSFTHKTLDTISRQAAIDEIDEWIKAFRENGHKESAAYACLIQDGIIQLPSAQPEIITCNDCVHSDTFPECADNDMPLKCLDIRYGGVMPDWYCEHAERRTDE